MWQDHVMAVCSLIFTFSIIVMILDAFKICSLKIGFKTGAYATAIALFVIGITSFTYGLRFHGGITVFSGILWAIYANKPEVSV